ncbi:MAG: pyrimidine 5'-nucleotidase [Caldilineales bacterium]|nr:pyrimidine 5'-nucleotidase [Caldilineales bacterium]
MNSARLNSEIELLLFDLDNTLYPQNLGLWAEIDQRIRNYVSIYLGVSPEEAHRVQKEYWLAYGTTLAGLMSEFQIDPDPYLDYVHDLDVTGFLGPNPALNQTLAALPQRKAIFTNASSDHARNILSTLDILPQFEALIGMAEVGYVCKPNPLAYERCLAALKVDPRRCVFIEDSAGNLPPARALGMTTVLIGEPAQGDADFYLQSVEDIHTLFAA